MRLDNAATYDKINLMIRFDHVSKRYGERKILDDICFELGDGDFLSIVGPSGSGKSTIIKLIIGQEMPSFGHVRCNGKDIDAMSREQLQKHRQKIGVVFQDALLMQSKTVFENVAFALEARGYSAVETIERTKEALKLVGIEHIQDHFPHQISGGEAQRAALARAICYKPEILLADEPTGHLDIENAKKVLASLLRINLHGTTVILTTHNLPLVQLAAQKCFYLTKEPNAHAHEIPEMSRQEAVR